MMWWNQMGMNSGQWVAMSLTMLVAWSLPVALVVWLVRRGVGGRLSAGSTLTPDRAEDLLAQRFARGEIDEAQFTRGRAVLRDTATRTP
ncbi:MAG: SHOCT domain-containing protein [Lapillicoccus sp.]